MEKRNMKNVITKWSIAGALLLLFGCTESKNPINAEKEYGQVSVNIRVQSGSLAKALAATPFSLIADSSVIIISASDMYTIQQTLTTTDSSVFGTISKIPSGIERIFRVDIYDSAKVLRYQGTAIADVIPDSTTQINIDIIRLSGDANIGGSIIDIPLTGLIAYFPFSGDHANHSLINLTAQNKGATLVQDRNSISEKACNFPNDTTVYITINDTSKLHFTNALSISYWAKFNETWSYASQATLTKSIYPEYSGFMLGVNQDNVYGVGKYVAFFQIHVNGVRHDIHDTLTYADISKWNHYVAIYSGTSIKLYINNQLRATKDVTGNITNSTSKLIIGGYNNPQSRRAVNRDIDDIRIYNAVLDQLDIKTLYDEK